MRDLGSRNGTYLNAGARQKTESPLKDGDIIELGQVRLRRALLGRLLRPRTDPGRGASS